MSNKKPRYKKVMVIDDLHLDRYTAQRNILKFNYASEVVLKDSADNALQYLKELSATPKNLPQLIFLDIHMPKIDGFGFLDEYDKLPDAVKNNCSIIMLTDWVHLDDINRAKNNIYVDRFLSKPLDKSKLEELITEN